MRLIKIENNVRFEYQPWAGTAYAFIAMAIILSIVGYQELTAVFWKIISMFH